MGRVAWVVGLALAIASPAAAAPLRAVPTVVPDGPVTSAVRLGDRLYLGGAFTHVGPRTGPQVRLDPASGRVAGAMPAADGPVAVAIGDGAGGFFIGGRFTRVGDAPRRNLAHVLSTGEVDPGFAPHPDGEVLALLLDGDRLYVGGQFATIGGRSRNRVAALHAGTGAVDPEFDPNVGDSSLAGRPEVLPPTPFVSSTPAPIPGTSQCRTSGRSSAAQVQVQRSGVLALAVANSRVYLGGWFSSVNGIERENLAAVSAQTGQLDPGFDPDANNPGYQPSARRRRADAAGAVDGLAVAGSSLYVAGAFTSVAGRSRSRLAKLDALTGAVDPVFDPLPDARLTSLVAAGGRLYVAGAFGSIGGAARSRLAALDAATGTADPTFRPVADGTVQALSLSGGRLYVAGAFRSIDGLERNRLAAVDATTGAVDPAFDPNADDNANTVAVSGGSVFAGGFFESVGGLSRYGLAALRLPRGEPDPAFDPRVDARVTALAASRSRVYAGLVRRSSTGVAPGRDALPREGRTVALDAADGRLSPGFRARRGAARSLAASDRRVFVAGLPGRRVVTALDARTGVPDLRFRPRLGGTVTSLVAARGRLFAGGFLQPLARGEKTPLPDAPNLGVVSLQPATGLRAGGFHPRIKPHATGVVTGIAHARGRLYVSGDFTAVRGKPRPHLAALDPSSGAADPRFRPPGLHTATQLAVLGSRLYVNSSAREAGQLTALNARTGRRGPGSSIRVTGSVCMLASVGGRLYAGGDFMRIAGGDQPRLAAFE